VLSLLELLNSIHHAGDPGALARYEVEPYVIAADIYGVRPHIGRDGWTWYTGSIGWMPPVALGFHIGINARGAMAAPGYAATGAW